MRQGISQVVKAQIAQHPSSVASDGAFCITPHQHFLAITLQQSWCTGVGIIHRVRAVLRAVFPFPANQGMGATWLRQPSLLPLANAKTLVKLTATEMPRLGHADFLAWHQASLILRTPAINWPQRATAVKKSSGGGSGAWLCWGGVNDCKVVNTTHNRYTCKSPYPASDHTADGPLPERLTQRVSRRKRLVCEECAYPSKPDMSALEPDPCSRRKVYSATYLSDDRETRYDFCTSNRLFHEGWMRTYTPV